LKWFILLIFILVPIFSARTIDSDRQSVPGVVFVAEDFQITKFFDINDIFSLAVHSEPEDIYLGSSGKIFYLDRTADRQMGEATIIALEGLSGVVSSMQWINMTHLLIGTQMNVYLAADADNDHLFEENKVILSYSGNPGNHGYATSIFDGQFVYTQLGSIDNYNCGIATATTAAGVSITDARCKVLRYTLNGTFLEIFTRGNRNFYGMNIHPRDNTVFATENNVDFERSNDLAREKFYWLLKGKHYGYPDLFIQQNPNIQAYFPPIITMEQGASPDQFDFIPSDTDKFPTSWSYHVIVAEYGSHHGAITGRKLQRIALTGEKNTGYAATIYDFISYENDIHPVGLAISETEGKIFVSTLGSNAGIWTIIFVGTNPSDPKYIQTQIPETTIMATIVGTGAPVQSGISFMSTSSIISVFLIRFFAQKRSKRKNNKFSLKIY
jgi:hypothetical protein